MKVTEVVVARILAALLLVGCVALFAPLVATALRLANGGNVTTTAWLAPLALLATGAVLMGSLARRPVALPLYLTAFVLWMATAGYFLFRFLRPA